MFHQWASQTGCTFIYLTSYYFLESLILCKYDMRILWIHSLLFCFSWFSTYCTGRRNSSAMELDTVGLTVWRIMPITKYVLLFIKTFCYNASMLWALKNKFFPRNLRHFWKLLLGLRLARSQMPCWQMLALFTLKILLPQRRHTITELSSRNSSQRWLFVSISVISFISLLVLLFSDLSFLSWIFLRLKESVMKRICLKL